MTILGRRGRGDILVIVEVAIPDQISLEEEDLLRRWAQIRDEKVDQPVEKVDRPASS